MIKKKLKLYYRIIIQNLFKILYGKILIPKNHKIQYDQAHKTKYVIN